MRNLKAIATTYSYLFDRIMLRPGPVFDAKKASAKLVKEPHRLGTPK